MDRDFGRIDEFLFDNLELAFNYIIKNADRNKVTVTVNRLDGSLELKGYDKNRAMEEFTIIVPPSTKNINVELARKTWLSKTD